MSNLTKELVFGQLESIDPYPIDFDEAWVWLGFSAKRSAKESIIGSGFIENEDFKILKPGLQANLQFDNHAGLTPQQKAAASRLESIRLTIDCFKSWAMMAQGKTKK